MHLSSDCNPLLYFGRRHAWQWTESGGLRRLPARTRRILQAALSQTSACHDLVCLSSSIVGRLELSSDMPSDGPLKLLNGRFTRIGAAQQHCCVCSDCRQLASGSPTWGVEFVSFGTGMPTLEYDAKVGTKIGSVVSFTSVAARQQHCRVVSECQDLTSEVCRWEATASAFNLCWSACHLASWKGRGWFLI